MQCKIFRGGEIEKVEAEINAWLKITKALIAHSSSAIGQVQITRTTTSGSKESKSKVNVPAILVTVFYDGSPGK